MVTVNHRRNHSQGASGENPRRTTANEPVVRTNEVKQQEHENSEQNTKTWSNDEENREEQSQQQAEEQSQQQAKEEQAREEHGKQQARRTKGLRPRQGEARGEAQ